MSIKVADPQLKADGTNRGTEGQTGLSIPRGGFIYKVFAEPAADLFAG
jgi:hypothetical protein